MKVSVFEKLSPEELAALPKKERIAYKKKRRTFKRIRALLVLLILLALVVSGVGGCLKNRGEKDPGTVNNEVVPDNQTPTPSAIDFVRTGNTRNITADLTSTNAVLINADTREMVAVKGDPNARIFPASMTKVLTLLVASENISDWTPSVYMTREIEEYCFVNECSNVGYFQGEIMAMSELPYGTILTSGADATLGMALYAVDPANSSGKSFEELHSAFADKMNEKLSELGLTSTHFTNAVGIHDVNHYTTAREMALIMYAAMESDFCRKVLTTRSFETAATAEHPDGQILSNLFLSRIGSKDCGAASVIAAKTGYVKEAGFCAVSYATGADGANYICVTAAGTSTNNSISDHAAIYKAYVK